MRFLTRLGLIGLAVYGISRIMGRGAKEEEREEMEAKARERKRMRKTA